MTLNKSGLLKRLQKPLLTLLSFFLLTGGFTVFLSPGTAKADKLEDALQKTGTNYTWKKMKLPESCDGNSITFLNSSIKLEKDKEYLFFATSDLFEVEACQYMYVYDQTLPQVGNSRTLVGSTSLRNSILRVDYTDPSKVFYCENISDPQDRCEEHTGIGGTADATAFLGTQEEPVNPPPDPDVDPTGQTQEEQEPEKTCSSEAGVLGWILCPIIEYLFGAISDIAKTIIEALLVVQPLSDYSGDGGSLKDVWNGFRVIANICFVIVLLVIIFGQALSIGFDAYTIKKMVPRLVIAAVAVNLSWFIVGFGIDIFNIMGKGVSDLILTPVNGLDQQFTVQVPSITGGEGEENLLGLAATGGAAYAALFAAKAFVTALPMILFACLIIILGVLLTLAFRQTLILILVVTAPIAFVAWVLPGTERVFKIWQDLFVKALLMYPMIMALLAAGELAARVVLAGDRDPTVLDMIMSILLNFGPLFLIPATFKFAGSALASFNAALTGNNFVANKQKQLREDHLQRKALANGGSLFQGNNALSRAANKGMAWTGAGPRAHMRRVGGNKEAIASEIRANMGRAAAVRAESDVMKDIAVDDKAQYFAMMAGNRRASQRLLDAKLEEIRAEGLAKGKSAAEINASQESWRQAKAMADRTGYSKATRLAAADMLTKSGYNIAHGQEGWNAMNAAAQEIAGSQGQANNLMNNWQYNMKGAGRFDQAGINEGGKYDFKAGWDKASLYDIGRGKKDTITAARTHIDGLLERARGGDMGALREASIMHAEMKELQKGASGAVSGEINKHYGQVGGELDAIYDQVFGGPAGAAGPTARPGAAGPTIAEDREATLGQWRSEARVYRRPDEGDM